jgi:hypothetical protein
MDQPQAEASASRNPENGVGAVFKPAPTIEEALRFHVDDIQASTHLTADVGKSYTLPQSLFLSIGVEFQGEEFHYEANIHRVGCR